jgi:sortase A
MRIDQRAGTSKVMLTGTALLFILSGAVLLGHSAIFYIKGAAVQFLLNRLWDATRGEEAVHLRGWPIKPAGRLRIPSLGVSLVVLNRADRESLAYGPGYIASSAPPGSEGNIAIAGHRDSFFRVLRSIAKGDVIELESGGAVQRFIVTAMSIADPGDTHWIDALPHHALTLITCYPFDYVGPAPKRYIVRARGVREDR